MAIYRGSGGSVSATKGATASEVAQDAATATAKAAEALESADNAAISAGEALTSANTALGHADAAAGHAASASTNATAANTAKTAAEAARDAAQTAQGLSEAARDASVVAKDASVAAKDAAIVAQNTAESHKNIAQSERLLAEAAELAASGHSSTAQGYAADALAYRNEANTARNAAETAQGLSEAARDAAQLAQAAAETAQAGAEAALNGADSRLTALEADSHTHTNKAVLDATTASYTTAEETKLAGIETGATADQTGAEIKALYESELDTNAFTDAEKNKLAGIAAGAEVNVQSDWNAISGDAAILNKPSIPASGVDFDPVGTDNSTDVTLNTASYDYLSLTGQEITLGQVDYATDISNIPATFTPSAHTHVKADITDFSDADYATAAQGALADTAVQPNDATLQVGTNDTTAGLIQVFGGTGSSEGGEIQIYNDATFDTYIDKWSIDVNADDFRVFNSLGKRGLVLYGNGDGVTNANSTALLYNNAERLITTSGGVDVTGTVTADGLNAGNGDITTTTGNFVANDVSNDGIKIIPANDTTHFRMLFRDSTNTTTKGDIRYDYSTDSIRMYTNADFSNTVFTLDSNGNVDVTGNISASGDLVVGNVTVSGHVSTGDYVDARDYVTDYAGTSDQEANLQAAADAAQAAGHGRLYLGSHGVIRLDNDVNLGGLTEVWGGGMDSLWVVYDENSSLGTRTDAFRITAANATDKDLYVHDFTIVGSRASKVIKDATGATIRTTTANTTNTTAGGFGLDLTGGGSFVRVERVGFELCRNQALSITNWERAEVTGCRLKNNNRGGIGTRATKYVDIYDNWVEGNGDDSIFALGVDDPDSVGNKPIGVNIHHNTIMQGQGIRVLSGIGGTINNNVCIRPIGFGISFGTNNDQTGEGTDATFGFVVKDNIVMDCLNRNYVDDYNGSKSYIRMRSHRTIPAGEQYVGQWDATDGEMQQPYEWVYADTSDGAVLDTSVAIIGAMHVTIEGNKCISTLESGATWASYGFPNIWEVTGSFQGNERTGANQFDTTGTGGAENTASLFDNLLDCDGLLIDSYCQHLIIRDNEFIMPKVGGNLFFQDSDADYGLMDVTVEGNKFFRFVDNPAIATSTTSTTKTLPNVLIKNNEFIGDPYFESAYRETTPDGSWLTDTSPYSNYAIDNFRTGNLTLIGNHFHDVSSVTQYDVSAPHNATFLDNILYCDPAVYGSFSTSNKGIGVVPDDFIGFKVMDVECNPTSARYRDFNSFNTGALAAITSTGIDVTGTVTADSIGIGTDSPSFPIDVQFAADSGLRVKSTTTHSNIYLDATGTGNPYLRFMRDGGNSFWVTTSSSDDLLFRPQANGTYSVDMASDYSTYFQDSTGACRVRIDPNATYAAIGTSTNHSLRLQTNSTARLTLNTSDAEFSVSTIFLGNSDAVNVAKYPRFFSQHYNGVNPVTMFGMNNDASNNWLLVGGGSNGTPDQYAASKISFYTAANNTTESGTERMVIQSDGQVGIGKAAGTALDVSGTIRGDTVRGDSLLAGVADTTNGIVKIYGGGTGTNEGGQLEIYPAADHDTNFDFWYIDAYQDDLRIVNGGNVCATFKGNTTNTEFGGNVQASTFTGTGTGSRFDALSVGADSDVYLYASGTGDDLGIRTGTSGAYRYWQFKDTGDLNCSSGGITFNSGTPLDDYDEGAFTPTIYGTTTAGTPTYSYNVGKYVKVGGLVHFQIRVGITALGGIAGNFRIGNLPFANVSDNNAQSSVSVGYTSGLTTNMSGVLRGYVPNNATFIVLRDADAGGGESDLASGDTNFNVMISGTYRTYS